MMSLPSPPALLALALAGAGMALLTPAGRAVLADALAGIAGRGKRVGPRTAMDSRGIVQESPLWLAEEAGLDLPRYALARALASEVRGDAPKEQKLGVGWAIRNHAGGPDGVYRQIMSGSKGEAQGLFARQSADGRYVATMNDPYEDDVAIAGLVLAGADADDPTGGATNFFSPRTQNVLHARDPDKYRPAAEIIRRWEGRGMEVVAVAGVDPDEQLFFRRVT